MSIATQFHALSSTPSIILTKREIDEALGFELVPSSSFSLKNFAQRWNMLTAHHDRPKITAYRQDYPNKEFSFSSIQSFDTAIRKPGLVPDRAFVARVLHDENVKREICPAINIYQSLWYGDANHSNIFPVIGASFSKFAKDAYQVTAEEGSKIMPKNREDVLEHLREIGANLQLIKDGTAPGPLFHTARQNTNDMAYVA